MGVKVNNKNKFKKLKRTYQMNTYMAEKKTPKNSFNNYKKVMAIIVY